MIHEIAPHKFDPVYYIKKPKPDDYCLYFEKEEVLLYKEGDCVRIPSFSDWKRKKQIEELYREAIYLFSIDERGYYLLLSPIPYEEENFEMRKITLFREWKPQYMGFAGITASQLYRWYSSRKFCGNCGSLTKRNEKEREIYCPECSQIEYPRISPAVIVAITDKERILLVKVRYGPYKNYALVAGYTEVGETLEETVIREVREEVGLRVKNLRYYKSQPWSFSGSMMAGFFAELDGADTVTLQESELLEAKWFKRNEIPHMPGNISIGQEMIEYFRNNRS